MAPKTLSPPLAPSPTTFPSESRLGDIKSLRILIDVVRLAERDYLRKTVDFQHRQSAKSLIFSNDAFRSVCSVLGIDWHAARLLILIFKARGWTGDPIFGYLVQDKTYEQFMNGQEIDIPDFDTLRYALDHRSKTKSSPGTRSIKKH